MAVLKQHEDGTIYLSNNWYVADVESACEDIDVTLTDDEKEAVLHDVAHAFDANYGISWEDFYVAIRGIIEERTNG